MVLEEDPFQDYFTGVDDAADLNDAYTLFEEAHRLFSRYISKFRAELSQCEAELKRSSDKGKAPRLLCSKREEELKDLRADLAKALQNEAELDKKVTVILQEYGLIDPFVESNTSVYQPQQKLDMIGQLRGEVDQVKADCNQWKENMDQLAGKKIDDLEAKLTATGDGIAETRAEVERTKATTDKTVVVYQKDAKAAQMELRETSNREKQISDLARCQARRETLEEVHARGFDFTEEIAQEKTFEAARADPIMKLGSKRRLLPRIWLLKYIRLF
uniref:Uncharacterized protein LOC104212555 n=1 Tax=Nicotiana sylvestris TaxID=4096 RepID=A0A1U7VCY3_NICSY|nr:PREDICTED: uncharacterized protein LOC104212555 [Nicotiana sylvestris]